MTLKHIAALAATIIATSTFAGTAADKKCGAGTCGKKEAADKAGATAEAASEATCGKKKSKNHKKEAICAKKEAACAKKEPAASGQ